MVHSAQLRPELGLSHSGSAVLFGSHTVYMRRRLIFISGSAVVVAGTLLWATVNAFASSTSTSSKTIANMPSLTVPKNYHPSVFPGVVIPSGDGLIVIAPKSAVTVPGGGARGSRVHLRHPEKSPPTSEPSSGSNASNDVSGKGAGKTKSGSNDPSDVKTKGPGAIKGTGKSRG